MNPGGGLLFLIFLGTGEFAGIADVRDGVLVLLDEQVHDVVVADELACGGLHIGLQIADDRLFLLTIAVDSTVALLEGHERPGNVEMDEPVTKTMKVQTFGRHIGGKHEANGAFELVEALDLVHQILVAVVTLEDAELRVLQAKVGRKVLGEEGKGLPAFGKDHQTVFRIFFVPNEFGIQGLLVVLEKRDESLIFGEGLLVNVGKRLLEVRQRVDVFTGLSHSGLGCTQLSDAVVAG